MIFEPLDFIARLATLVPKPRVNLTCFHGAFAPNSKPLALEQEEPINLVNTIKAMGLRYVVITSVDRNDLRNR